MVALAMTVQRKPIMLLDAVLQSFRDDPGASGM
jgi:hypothetical protein